MHKKYEFICLLSNFSFKLIVFIAMCVYKYVFNKHVIGCGEGRGGGPPEAPGRAGEAGGGGGGGKD